MSSLTARTSLIAALAFAQPVFAQDDAAAAPDRIANGTQFGAWTVVCEATAVNETACVLQQRLVRTEDSAFLAEIMAFWNKDRSTSYLAARVPVGAYLPAAFGLKPDGAEDQTSLIWQACSAELCEALLELTPEITAELAAAPSVIAGYRPGLTRDPAVFKMDFKGLDAGLAALSAPAAP